MRIEKIELKRYIFATPPFSGPFSADIVPKGRLDLKKYDVCGRIEPPEASYTLQASPPLPGTFSWLLAGTARCPRTSQHFHLVWEVRVLGISVQDPRLLKVKCVDGGAKLEEKPVHLLPHDTDLPIIPISFQPTTEWESAEEGDGALVPVAAGGGDLVPRPPARRHGKGKEKEKDKDKDKEDRRQQKLKNKKKKRQTPADGAGEALRLGQLADQGQLSPADLEKFSRSDLLGILLALNQPASNKSAPRGELLQQLLQAFADGARLQELWFRPEAKEPMFMVDACALIWFFVLYCPCLHACCLPACMTLCLTSLGHPHVSGTFGFLVFSALHIRRMFYRTVQAMRKTRRPRHQTSAKYVLLALLH